jgi:DNA mismatch repair ATPase MutS
VAVASHSCLPAGSRYVPIALQHLSQHFIIHKDSFRSFIAMIGNISPEQFYQQRISELQIKLKKLYKRRTLIGWLRLIIILITIVAVYYTWHLDIPIIIAIIIVGLSFYFFIVAKDTDNKEEIENLETLKKINEKELQYFSGKYDDNYDGKNLEPEHHNYAADLDLFGKNSLYQYINRCNAENAKQLLAKRLLHPLNKTEIFEQQQAVKELSEKILWRQQVQAYGLKNEISLSTEERILQWLQSEEKHFDHSFFKFLLFFFPIITLSVIYLFIADYINTGVFTLLLIGFFSIAGSFSKKITPVYNLLSKVVSEIGVLYNELNWFEKESFQSEYLKTLQQKLKQDSSITASKEILHLKKILTRFDARLNIVAFPVLNTLFLWDLWQYKALKKWKQQNKSIVPNWFEAIASLEVINTFSTLSFNHPGWCFPNIADEYFILKGEEIGHLLIPENQRVNNSFKINGIAKIDLITGSNMAGKSTFLRSIGVNMILAYAGAPVCAKSFTVSISKLMSSMRIADNLAENTSTFYAELKKLKSIIDAVNNNEKVFIMLDEILRGTNSLDRHTGSSALIKQLIRKDAVALIATHDVELAKLENDFPANISNYHFDVQVSGEELFFDYTLKTGICTSLNASLLMKKIGIELN